MKQFFYFTAIAMASLCSSVAHAISGITPDTFIEDSNSFSFQIASDGVGLYDGSGAILGPADALVLLNSHWDLNYFVQEQGLNPLNPPQQGNDPPF
jgi:hypothetical protein